MKLVSFNYNGSVSFGVVEGDVVIDIGQSLAGQHPDLRSLISSGNDETISGAMTNVERYELADVQLLPPIMKPDKILCVGLNYESHRKETGRPVAKYPTIFTRFANTQIGHQGPIWLPSESTNLDYEGELAVIIGKSGWKIPEEKALEHIAGYSCYNDATIRDWQRHTSQFTPGKNFPHTGSFGPWLVTADEIPDPSSLSLTTCLNGEVMQHATTDMLIFTIPVLIHYISRFTRLEAGDVISTGTPGGVGFKRDPQVFMKTGDIVEIEISGIGTLTNSIKDEPAETE